MGDDETSVALALVVVVVAVESVSRLVPLTPVVVVVDTTVAELLELVVDMPGSTVLPLRLPRFEPREVESVEVVVVDAEVSASLVVVASVVSSSVVSRLGNTDTPIPTPAASIVEVDAALLALDSW